MRKTKYIIIGVLFLVMVSVLSLREVSVQKTEENKIHVNQQKEKQRNTNEVEILKRYKVKNENKRVNNLEPPYTYSDDPVVEARIISLKYSVCFTYYMFKKNPNINMETYYRTSKQKNYFKKASANCEKLNAAHPEYLLNISTQEQMELMKDKVATSSVGRQMYSFYKKTSNASISDQDVVELYSTLGNEYPELITYPFSTTLHYEIEKITPDIKEILATTNTQYVYRINSLSKIYLSCQLSADCEMGSSTLMSLCLSEPNFCVSSFDEFFKEQLSQGVQADVLLVLPYFKRLYNVD